MSALQRIRHDDERFMAVAIRFARRHVGQTSENPSVGALIVRNDGEGPCIVGRGVTAVGGRPHAEIEALSDAGGLACGATVYVTLEPCSHYGQTPPCADVLAAAGVKRVVVAVGDPDPRVNGRGIAQLRHAGIEVVEHVFADTAEEGLSAYLCCKRLSRPEVTLKLAVSADGCIGRTGEGNVSVSGTVSWAQTHILRVENDAILIGIGTAVADDPMLDCRLPGLEACSPIRIVVDSRLQLSLNCRLVKTARQRPVWIVCDEAVASNRIDALVSIGCRIIRCKMQGGRIDLHDLLIRLGQAGINSLLVEGGAQIAASFWNCGLVDRFILFQSPLVIGIGGYKAPDFSQRAGEYRKMQSQQFGEDRCTQWKRIV